MNGQGTLLRQGIRQGLHKGWSGFIWMMKIIVPISLLTDLLAWSGWLHKIDPLIQPLMGLLHLPSMAALPLLIGMLANIYGGIAAMAVLPFTREEMTLMAIFLLISHNMIQEGIIQGKSGINIFKATFIRLVTATLTVMAVAPFLMKETLSQAPSPLLSGEHVQPLADMLQDWGLTMLFLSVKIFLIIMVILTLLEVLKQTGWIDHLVRILAPFLRVMGLSRQVGFLWLTAIVFGLAYGGAVIIEESKAGHITREELETLHLSVGINHSMVEDPTLFLSLGLSPFWLWIPRLIVAIVATRLFTLWQNLSGRFRGAKNG